MTNFVVLLSILQFWQLKLVSHTDPVLFDDGDAKNDAAASFSVATTDRENLERKSRACADSRENSSRSGIRI